MALGRVTFGGIPGGLSLLAVRSARTPRDPKQPVRTARAARRLEPGQETLAERAERVPWPQISRRAEDTAAIDVPQTLAATQEVSQPAIRRRRRTLGQDIEGLGV